MGIDDVTNAARGVITRNAFVNAALEAGFHPYLPVCADDIHVILTRKEDAVLRPVILRQTWSAADALEGGERWIGFAAAGLWHVAPDGAIHRIVVGGSTDRLSGGSEPVDLGALELATVYEFDDYVLRPFESWPPLELRTGTPTPWNVALLACLQQALEPRNFAGGGDDDAQGLEGAVASFIELCARSGWMTVGYDQRAGRIASAHDDGWLRLRNACARRLDAVLCYVNSGEKFAGGWYSGAVRKGLLRSITIRAGMLAAEARVLNEPVLAERITGSVMGAAIGDALGLPVEGLSAADIRERFGADGLTGFAEASGRIGTLSGEAQIMICVAAGLASVEIADDQEDAGTPDRSMMLFDVAVEFDRVRVACLEWRLGQTGCVEAMQPCAVTEHAFLRERRPHGQTTARALAAGGEVAVNDSKGNGCMLRVVPMGLAHPIMMPEDVFARASAVAGLTHGHPVAKAAAGVLATILSRLTCGQRLAEAVGYALSMAPDDHAGREVRSLTERAQALARGGPPSWKTVETIGKGFVASEALAIAVYCVLSTSDFHAAVTAAVNHSGDSDATGAITGAIAGALYGTNGIPLDLLRGVEGRDAIVAIAADLAMCTGLPPWHEGQIGEIGEDEMLTPEDDARDAEHAIRDAVKDGMSLEGAIGAFAPDLPKVAAKVRAWAARRARRAKSGTGGSQIELLS